MSITKEKAIEYWDGEERRAHQRFPCEFPATLRINDEADRLMVGFNILLNHGGEDYDDNNRPE